MKSKYKSLKEFLIIIGGGTTGIFIFMWFFERDELTRDLIEGFVSVMIIGIVLSLRWIWEKT